MSSKKSAQRDVKGDLRFVHLNPDHVSGGEECFIVFLGWEADYPIFLSGGRIKGWHVRTLDEPILSRDPEVERHANWS